MPKTRKEIIDKVEVTIVEDSREELHDFLGQAQEIENMDEEDREQELGNIFGSQETTEEPKETEAKEEDPKAQERGQQIQDRTASSRAGSDVALAMMIADQAAAEAAENPCYVVHGAKMVCSFGSREARLVVPMDHGVCLKGKPQLTTWDSEAITNVMCFGNCFSPDNPHMEEAAIEAANRYNEQSSRTIWGKLKDIFFGVPKEVDTVSDGLKAACICECIPSFSKLWKDGNGKTRIDGKSTLIQTDTLVCQYGGVIRIVDNGQDS